MSSDPYLLSSYQTMPSASSLQRMTGSALTQVELHIQCRNLPPSSSVVGLQPQVFLFEEDLPSEKWKELGRTEMIRGSCHPQFASSICTSYQFESPRPLRFVVIDVERPGAAMEQQQLLGTIETSLAELIAAPGQRWCRNLEQDGPVGQLVVSVEEVQEMAMSVKLHFEGRKLERRSLFGRTDTYLCIHRLSSGDEWEVVHRTGVVKRERSPIWERFTLPVQTLCNGSFDRPLLVQCVESHKDEVLGEFRTTLRRLQDLGKQRQTVNLMEPGSSTPTRGQVRVLSCEVVKEHTFLDFLRGGLRMNMMAAVDFTASNGDPSFATSLHYRNPYSPNEYVRAITSVGEVLRHYDSDQSFPAYGFGAKPDPQGPVSHCFPLNGKVSHPEVYGIDGILEAYHSIMNTLVLQGPTNLSEIIRTAADYAHHQEAQHGCAYTVLLILTDGVISDMNNTIGEIVRASHMPLSIVIVGVGSANFRKMDVLDACSEPLIHHGDKAARDMVKFLPYRDYQSSTNHRLLAERLLREIPKQIVTYFKMKQMAPPSPVTPGDGIQVTPSTGVPLRDDGYATLKIPRNDRVDPPMGYSTPPIEEPSYATAPSTEAYAYASYAQPPPQQHPQQSYMPAYLHPQGQGANMYGSMSSGDYHSPAQYSSPYGSMGSYGSNSGGYQPAYLAPPTHPHPPSGQGPTPHPQPYHAPQAQPGWHAPPGQVPAYLYGIYQ